MKKDFDNWNSKKKKVEMESARFYTVREIWWCNLGVNIGTELDGKGENYLRPCVIARSFGPSACMVVPLTTSNREHILRIPVGLVQGEEAKANISQIRILDTRRLAEKVGFMDKEMFVELKKRIKNLF
jgi:mRNA interferase MazF